MLEILADAILVAIGGAVVAGAVAAVRYFFAMSSCVKLLKARLQALDAKEAASAGEHDVIFSRLGDLRERIAGLESKLDLLIQKS